MQYRLQWVVSQNLGAVNFQAGLMRAEVRVLYMASGGRIGVDLNRVTDYSGHA